MEADTTLTGLQKIKSLFSDEDKKKDIAKKSIIPLSLLALVGGTILAKRFRRPINNPGWGAGERSSFINDIGDAISKGI